MYIRSTCKKVMLVRWSDSGHGVEVKHNFLSHPVLEPVGADIGLPGIVAFSHVLSATTNNVG